MSIIEESVICDLAWSKMPVLRHHLSELTEYEKYAKLILQNLLRLSLAKTSRRCGIVTGRTGTTWSRLCSVYFGQVE